MSVNDNSSDSGVNSMSFNLTDPGDSPVVDSNLVSAPPVEDYGLMAPLPAEDSNLIAAPPVEDYTSWPFPAEDSNLMAAPKVEYYMAPYSKYTLRPPERDRKFRPSAEDYNLKKAGYSNHTFRPPEHGPKFRPSAEDYNLKKAGYSNHIFRPLELEPQSSPTTDDYNLMAGYRNQTPQSPSISESPQMDAYNFMAMYRNNTLQPFRKPLPKPSSNGIAQRQPQIGDKVKQDKVKQDKVKQDFQEQEQCTVCQIFPKSNRLIKENHCSRLWIVEERRVVNVKDMCGICQDNSKTYAIVSHVWGAIADIHLELGGVNWMVPIGNPNKLGWVVRSMKKQPELKYVWMDVICIDQSSAEEIGREVRRMSGYFQGAIVTFVLDEKLAGLFSKYGLHPLASDSQQAEILKELNSTEEMACAWLNRVWTAQELFLSKSILLVWEKVIVNANIMDEIVRIVQNTKTHTPMNRNSWLYSFYMYREMRIMGRNASCLAALVDLGKRESDVELDKIYGAKSMFRFKDQITVDYTLSIHKALREMACVSISNGDCTILATLPWLSAPDGFSWLPSPTSIYGLLWAHDTRDYGTVAVITDSGLQISAKRIGRITKNFTFVCEIEDTEPQSPLSSDSFLPPKNVPEWWRADQVTLADHVLNEENDFSTTPKRTLSLLASLGTKEFYFELGVAGGQRNRRSYLLDVTTPLLEETVVSGNRGRKGGVGARTLGSFYNYACLNGKERSVLLFGPCEVGDDLYTVGLGLGTEADILIVLRKRGDGNRKVGVGFVPVKKEEVILPEWVLLN
ncbi:hypothetical protein HK096_001943 [Nowakowskiella sp. JEL0078]|nr:hypothetical protein HK096_001943 [Nowakowskiella sp. JEL0078]